MNVCVIFPVQESLVKQQDEFCDLLKTREDERNKMAGLHKQLAVVRGLFLSRPGPSVTVCTHVVWPHVLKNNFETKVFGLIRSLNILSQFS